MKDIKVIALTDGTFLIGKVVKNKDNKGGYEITGPAIPMPNQQQNGMTLQGANLFASIDQNKRMVINVKPNQIFWVGPVSEEISRYWDETFGSGLVTPPEKALIL